MLVRRPTLLTRMREWAGNRIAREVWAGRLRKNPARDTTAYARIMNIGGWQTSDKRPLIKPTPANLRMFGKTPYARRAIRRIKDPLANLPWEICPLPKVKWNGELKRQAQIATQCFDHPNHDDSACTFIEQLIEDLMINGAGCYEQQIGADPIRPLWMWPVDSLSIQINPKWDGGRTDDRYYQTLGYGNIGGVQGIGLRNEELVYIRLEPSTENPFGLGPLEVAFASINRKLGVENYAGKLASNAQPENLLLFPGMEQAELDTVRGWWRNDVEGQGQTPILSPPGGENAAAQVLKLRGTDDKALFLAYQELLVREIATAFCISAMSLNIERDVNRNTAEVVDDMDWDNAVVPTGKRLETYVTRETLHARLGFSQLHFRFIGLERQDQEAESKIYETEYKSNAVTPNEYRASRNKPPIASVWGDMTFADVQVAQSAARGTAEIDDPDLPAARPSPKTQED